MRDEGKSSAVLVKRFIHGSDAGHYIEAIYLRNCVHRGELP